jgi:hypothetical protein
MQKDTKNIFLIALFSYVALASVVLYYTKWYSPNPDTFQYIAIAHHYIHGDFYAAVNAWWSPFFSWLIMLPVVAGIDEILSVKLIQVITGIFTLIAWRRLVSNHGPGGNLNTLLVFVSIPFIVSYGLLNGTPDLLFMTVLFFILDRLLLKNQFISISASVLTGLLGGLLYLCKAFGFPLFIFLILLSVVFEYRSIRAFIPRKNIIVCILTFLFFSTLWITLISVKEKKLTLSETVSFNLSYEVAKPAYQQVSLPVLSDGIYVPPYNSSLAAWEEPGNAVRLTSINPLKDFNYYKKILKRNVLTIWYFDFRNQAGLFLLLMLVSTTLIWKKPKRPVLFLLMTMLAIYTGYSLVLVHTRYIWTCTFLILIVSFSLLNELEKKFQTLIFILALTVSILAVKRPLKEILFTGDIDLPRNHMVNALKHPLTTMEIFYRNSSYLHNAALQLKDNVTPGKNFISVFSGSASQDIYASSLQLVLNSKGKYLGQINSMNPTENFTTDIHYIFIWDDISQPPEMRLHELFSAPEIKLKVYKLK